MTERKALIIGAGPAGLTAAYELLKRSDIKPVVVERDAQVGGISKTIVYKGNRMDLGGHRFFSKSDIVMDWWRRLMPVEDARNLTPEKVDRVMMIRNRISRIYFLRRFFDYPITLSAAVIRNLGFIRLVKIGFSYTWIRLFPVRDEQSLEDFYVNRFGRELYETFFKDYTHKVWGVPCSEISPDWGSQRVKGLSIGKALLHMARQMMPSKKSSDVSQKTTETSLIEKFLYPKLGPGQLWEYAAQEIVAGGGEVHTGCRVTAIHTGGDRVCGVTVRDSQGIESRIDGDFVISTMPVRELISIIDADVPAHVREVAEGLIYRDFMTAGLLLKRMNVPEGGKSYPDTWIYIQERDVKVGRVQIFNNWSPYMVSDPDRVFIGLEYFVNEGDELWNMADADFIAMAAGEMEKIGLIARDDVIDATVTRVEKAYPAYFGTYGRMDEIRRFTDTFQNLFLVGRNGMHKYNNQDHSMLTAIAAVDNILNGAMDKENIWSVNTEQEYHEEQQTTK